MDAIMKRRSIRKFQDRAVETEKRERLLRAAMQSPTGHNAQEWEFLVIENEATRLAVSRMSPTTVCAKNAPLLIIVLANMERAVKEVPIWVSNMAAACQNIITEAEYLGLGSCWLSCFPYPEKMDYASKLFDLPETVKPYGVLAIGYKEREKEAVDRFDVNKIHYEKY